MIDETQLADLLRLQHKNQLALATALEEIPVWMETNGGLVAAGNARDALATLDSTHGQIEQTLAWFP